jgi:hypothetical protein
MQHLTDPQEYTLGTPDAPFLAGLRRTLPQFSWSSERKKKGLSLRKEGCLSTSQLSERIGARREMVSPEGLAQARRINPPTSEIRKRMIKMKNKSFATPAAAAAIPKNPNTAAIKATMKKISAQRNM